MNHFIISFLRLANNFRSVYCLSVGYEGLLENKSLFAIEKTKMIRSGLDCNWFISRSKSRKFQNRVGNPKITPKRIRKISLFKNFKRIFNFELTIRPDFWTKWWEFQEIALFVKILIKLHHILVLSVVLDFGRIFENFETKNSQLGFYVTHFSNKIPSY